jgi:diacylglycerol kinase (ATP)
MKVAVVAHRRKSFGGGLIELRQTLVSLGVDDLLWFEVNKSRKAPKRVRQAIADGAELVFVWGGDGTVQRCLDVLADTDIPLAVLPAGTANLFASNLDIPQDLAEAVAIGLRGERRKLDVGRINGERFGVMAGIGADALMIRDADGGLKDRFGRGAYVVTGARNLAKAESRVKVRVDGKKFYKGYAGCVLVGNVGKVFGGIEAFENASPEDGVLDLAVVTARSAAQWSRVLARVTFGTTGKSKYVKTASAQRVDIRLKRPQLFELDGGDRKKVKSLKIRVEPRALTVCVPRKDEPQ